MICLVFLVGICYSNIIRMTFFNKKITRSQVLNFIKRKKKSEKKDFIVWNNVGNFILWNY